MLIILDIRDLTFLSRYMQKKDAIDELCKALILQGEHTTLSMQMAVGKTDNSKG